MSEEGNLYAQLEKRKEAGERLNWDSITYEELKQLWWVEKIADARIAKLYDIRPREVTTKREVVDVNNKTMIMEKFFNMSPEEQNDIINRFNQK